MAGTMLRTAENEMARPFRWIGGLPCLDFNNTVGWPDVRGEPWPHPWSERLTGFETLVQWSHEAHLLTEVDATRLLARAAMHPDHAAGVLGRALHLREALHWLLVSAVSGSRPEAGDLDTLNQELQQGRLHQRLVAIHHGFGWAWTDEQDLGRALASVAESAADLLVSEQLDHLRLCAGDRCGWMFLNASGRRRWCVMSDCGNRAKARRHYQRTRAAAG